MHGSYDGSYDGSVVRRLREPLSVRGSNKDVEGMRALGVLVSCPGGEDRVQVSA